MVKIVKICQRKPKILQKIIALFFFVYEVISDMGCFTNDKFAPRIQELANL